MPNSSSLDIRTYFTQTSQALNATYKKVCDDVKLVKRVASKPTIAL